MWKRLGSSGKKWEKHQVWERRWLTKEFLRGARVFCLEWDGEWQDGEILQFGTFCRTNVMSRLFWNFLKLRV